MTTIGSRTLTAATIAALVSADSTAKALHTLYGPSQRRDRFDLAPAKPKAWPQKVAAKPYDGSTRQQRRAQARIECNAWQLKNEQNSAPKMGRRERRAFVRRSVNESVS